MDPRHPEQAVSRLKELIKQYDTVEEQMKKTTTSAGLAALEREGSLVVQEICLVAPRVHEAMMQTSRQRRKALSQMIAAKNYIDQAKFETPDTEVHTVGYMVEEPVEKPKNKTTKKKAKK